MTDQIDARRVVASTVGGALVGRLVADLLGAPAWVGGIIGAAAPIVRAVGVDQTLPVPVATALRVLAMPGEGIGRVMYPDGLRLQAPPEDPES